MPLILVTMNHLNPILEDYRLLVVYRNIGVELLQQLKTTMMAPPYAVFFKNININESNELHFSYLQYNFKTGIELFFDYSKLPKTALLATYYLNGQTTAEEIVSYTFDLNYNVNDIYALSDFAGHYLVDFHQNIKKTFSEHHWPFTIKFTDK